MSDGDRTAHLYAMVSGLAAQCRRWRKINGSWTKPHEAAADATHMIEAIAYAIERGDVGAVRHLADMADNKLAITAALIRPLNRDMADSLATDRRLVHELRTYG